MYMCVLYSYIYIIICINIHPPFKWLMFWNIAYIIIYIHSPLRMTVNIVSPLDPQQIALLNLPHAS